jgi:hypothetical protein
LGPVSTASKGPHPLLSWAVIAFIAYAMVTGWIKYLRRDRGAETPLSSLLWSTGVCVLIIAAEILSLLGRW